MPLGTEVGLGLGGIVLDGDPAHGKGHSSPTPLFSACLLWPNGCPSTVSELLYGMCSVDPPITDANVCMYVVHC